MFLMSDEISTGIVAMPRFVDAAQRLQSIGGDDADN